MKTKQVFSYRNYFLEHYRELYKKMPLAIESSTDHLALFLENQRKRILLRKEKISDSVDFSNLLE